MFYLSNKRDAFGHMIPYRTLSEAGVNAKSPINNQLTRLFVFPAKNGSISDFAKGNSNPIELENVGVYVENGLMVFGGSSYLRVPANTLSADVLIPTHAWTIDMVFNAQSGHGMQCLFGHGETPRFDVLYNSDVSGSNNTQIGGLVNNFAEVVPGTSVQFTLEYFDDGTGYKMYCYMNGVKTSTSPIYSGSLPEIYRTAPWGIGVDGSQGSAYRTLWGTVKAYRIQSGALYSGQNFTPDLLNA